MHREIGYMVDRILDTARSGMMEAVQRASSAAAEVSRAFTSEDPGDPISAIVDLNMSLHSYSANAKVVKTAEEMSRAVLDLLA